MLYQIYAMTVKELKVMLRDRGALVSLFAIPIVFIFIMSAAGVGGVRRGSSKPLEVLVVNQDAGDLAAQALGGMRALDGLTVVDEVNGVPLTRATAESLIADQEYPVAVVFPADFSARIRAAAGDPQAEPATVSFIADPAGNSQLLQSIQGTVQSFVQRTAASAQAPEQLRAVFDNVARQVPADQAPVVTQIARAVQSEMAAGDTLDGASSAAVRFEQVAPPNFVVNQFPDPVEQNVPGYTIFGVFFIVQALATSLLREKEDGSWRRLQAAPMPRAALLLGKLVPYYMVNLVQVALMFAIGTLVFGMRLGNSPFALVVVTVAMAAAATGLGLLVASIGKTAQQVNSLAAFLAIVLAALGGMMFPSFLMPAFMQTLGQFTPHAWALSGYQDVIVRGLSFSAVMAETGALLAFAAVFFGFALWRFRFE